MKALFSTLVLSLMVTTAYADALIPLSYRGKASIDEVATGKITHTIRTTDRTQTPFNYKVNMILPLVNSAETEDARSFEEQIAANAYGSVTITSLDVKSFANMSPEERTESLKFYSQEKIDEAKGILTIMRFRFNK